MNQIERLREDLARRFPELAMEIDAPDNPAGSHWLDIRRPGLTAIVVEWRPDRGFGVSTPADDGSDSFAGPDEVYPNVRAAFERIVRLVVSRGSAEPPTAVGLAELRKSLGLSQAELAGRAGVGQPNLSQIEGRGDIKLSTLARVLSAMGATLVVQAVFPDGTARQLDLATAMGSEFSEKPESPAGRPLIGQPSGGG